MSQIYSSCDSSSSCALDTVCFSICILYFNLKKKSLLKSKTRSAEMDAPPEYGLQGAQQPHELCSPHTDWNLAGQTSLKFQDA